MKKKILFIMGPTNCGKTTVINKLENSNRIHGFYPVLVGKKLREMYPPDYFDGQAAPAKTDDIAFKLMCDGINDGFSFGKIPVVDGQPRNQVQLELCEEYFKLYDCKIVMLWAPKNIRIERAKNRDNDPAKLKLSMDRMDGDSITLFDLWMQMSNYDTKVVNTNRDINKIVDDIIDFVNL